MVGEGALIHELYKAGFTITDVNPDFVIVGETRSYNWDMIHKAAYFVANGARFIATNPDTHGRGFYPACGALCAGIEKISGRKPFYVFYCFTHASLHGLRIACMKSTSNIGRGNQR